MGTENNLGDFSLGSQLRMTAHDTGMSTWARLSPDMAARKAGDAAYAVGHALSDAMDVLKAAAPLVVAAELERLAAAVDGAPDPAGDAWLRAETAGRREIKRALRARASELRGED